MSEHTQGKISEENGFLYSSVIGNNQGYQIAIVDHEFSDFPVDIIYANARRLAAAWNACEGLPTAEVEELSGNGGFMAVKSAMTRSAVVSKVHNDAFDELTSERDKLRAELAAANARIAKLEALVAERDAMLGKRPCQNSRCNELNAARALLRDISNDGALDMGDTNTSALGARVRSYLDACDTLEGNKPVDANGCKKCGDILPDGYYCKAPACPLNPSMKGK